ncbi:hypothetical protein [Rhizobium sp.]|jgi:hypothetical protein|uniref:hypothetical protein n=1 Tax=Rhizobium sp. TaxID=391 RepID=UPI000E7F22DE|nr:hypothetical protein [Rhizobium sp.]
MLFGQSIFQSVVERLSLEDAEKGETADAVVNYRVSGLSTGFVQDTGETQQAPCDWAQGQYLDLMEDAPWLHSPAHIPEHLTRLSPDEIAVDLGLIAEDDIATLQAKRRAFAMDNHPDRVHANFVQSAHIRMTIANSLVDEALQRRAPYMANKGSL